jgi:DNA repair protein RadC
VQRSRRASLRLEITHDDERLPGDVRSIPKLFMSWGLHKEPQECMWIVAYDATLTVRTVIEIARGTHVKVDVHLPTLLAGVLTSGSERFMLVHNHPSNDITPSDGDKLLTTQVQTAASACGLYLEDHFIICPNGKWMSFVQRRLLTPVDYVEYSGAASYDG